MLQTSTDLFNFLSCTCVAAHNQKTKGEKKVEKKIEKKER